jgi:hypothetical protein
MMKAFISRNMPDMLLSLVLAVITGFIFSYPNFKVEKNIVENKLLHENFIYSPLVANNLGNVQDEVHHLTLSKKVMDGIWSLSDVHIYEHRDDVNPVGKLPYIIGGILSRIFGSVISFAKWKNFLFPFLSVIIGYFFLLSFLKNRWIASWGVILILSGYSGFQIINAFLFRFNSVFMDYYPIISVLAEKYPSYQLIFPFTFLFYFFCYQLLRRNNNTYCIMTGIFAGLSFYLYFYSFLGIGMQLGFLIVWTSFQRKRDLSLRFLVSGVIALLIGLFHIKNTLVFMSDPNHIFKSMAIGLTKSLDYNIFKAGLELMVLGAILVFFFWKIGAVREKIAFIFSIGVPVFLLMLLSGVTLSISETQHFHTFEFRIALFLSVLLLISILLDKDYSIRRVRLLPLLQIGLTFVIILNSTQIMASELYYQSKKSSLYYHRYIIDRDIVEAYNWINSNTSKDAVILSIDAEQINLVPIYTGRYVYIPDLIIGMSPIDEVFQRIKQAFGFYGIGRQTLAEILNYETPYELMLRLKSGDDVEKFHQIHHEFKKQHFATLVLGAHFSFDKKSLAFQHYQKYFTPKEIALIPAGEGKRRFVPVNLLEEQLTDYRPALGDTDLLKYKVDYIWFGPFEEELSGAHELNSDQLMPVFNNKSVKIYQVIGTSSL